MAGDLDNLRVVLVATRNPLNIGAAARAMSNFGVRRLRVVNPYEKAFREARSAVGAAGLLAKAEQYDGVAEAVADCRLVVGTTAVSGRDLQHRLQGLVDGGRQIKRQLRSAPVALLFGSERYGLSNEELSHCHWLMRIPTREEHGSMNLGQAVAVTLYEIVRSRAASLQKPDPKRAAPAEELERMTRRLEDVLDRSGYVHAGVEGSTRIKIRRLI